MEKILASIQVPDEVVAIAKKQLEIELHLKKIYGKNYNLFMTIKRNIIFIRKRMDKSTTIEAIYKLIRNAEETKNENMKKQWLYFAYEEKINEWLG